MDESIFHWQKGGAVKYIYAKVFWTIKNAGVIFEISFNGETSQ